MLIESKCAKKPQWLKMAADTLVVLAKLVGNTLVVRRQIALLTAREDITSVGIPRRHSARCSNNLSK